MTDAVCYQQSLDTLQRLCFHGPTSFRGYLTKKPKQKTSFATVLGVVREAHKEWPAAAPELCWCALSGVLGVWHARDVRG